MPRRATAAALRAALDDVPAVDQHAHPLSGRERQWSLPELLSESRAPQQQAQVREHPVYHRALRDLGGLLGVAADEEAIAAARESAGFDAHTRRLLATGGFEALFVDDGFPVAGALDLETQAALSGCPVRRVLRIETVAEAAAVDWPPFGTARDTFRNAVDDALARGAVALKTIAAYRCGLDLPAPDAAEAEAAYAAWRRTVRAAGEAPARLSDPRLVALFLADAIDVARRRPVPLQIHTGLGDADLVLHRADPARLGPVIADAGAAGVPVVLLHCYPYVRQAAWLASVHPHVFVDLSLTLLLAGHRGVDIVLEAFELAPAGKLLFATDASRAAEMFFLAARWWRDALAGALGRMVDDGAIDENTGGRWAASILAVNARRLYEL